VFLLALFIVTAPARSQAGARPLPWLEAQRDDEQPASLGAYRSAQTGERGELVERVVAVVDRQTVTLIDVKRAAAIEIAKQAGAAVFMRDWPEGMLDDVRKHLVQRLLLLEEARRYSQPEPSDAEVDAALKAFRAGFPDERAFARFLERTTLTVETLKDDLRRARLVDRFLEFRIKARIEVKEADVQAYRAAHPELASASDDDVARRLQDELFVKRTFDYLHELLERSDVRLIGDLDDRGFVGSLEP
jgi:hypothetical protein